MNCLQQKAHGALAVYLVAFGFLLTMHIHTTNGLSCTECEKADCPELVCCFSGFTTLDICGCCKACTKMRGDQCGGIWNHKGLCGPDDVCLQMKPKMLPNRGGREGMRCGGRGGQWCGPGLKCVGKAVRVDGQGTCVREATNCPPGIEVVNCRTDPCSLEKCSGNSDATCVANYCGGCSARFYDQIGQQIINCKSGQTLPTLTELPTAEVTFNNEGNETCRDKSTLKTFMSQNQNKYVMQVKEGGTATNAKPIMDCSSVLREGAIATKYQEVNNKAGYAVKSDTGSASGINKSAIMIFAVIVMNIFFFLF